MESLYLQYFLSETKLVCVKFKYLQYMIAEYVVQKIGICFV